MTNNYRVAPQPLEMFMDQIEEFMRGRDFCLIYKTTQEAIADFDMSHTTFAGFPAFVWNTPNLIIRYELDPIDATCRFIIEEGVDRLRGLRRDTIVVAQQGVIVPTELENRFR